VLELSFGKAKGFPKFHVLDSTDPTQIAAIESRIDLKRTLFIVSSKSGSTLEPNIFKQYFFEHSGRDGSRFVAITDPRRAGGERQILATFRLPSIGVAALALSDFG
jgi:glucose-6-phosphate isomerase